MCFSNNFLYAEKTSDTYKNNLQKIYYSFDKKEYSKYINKIELSLKSTSDSLLLLYYSALAHHNYGKIVYNENSDFAYKLFSKAAENLEFVLVQYKNNNLHNKLLELEINILLSDVLAKKSSLETVTAIFTGNTAYKYFQKAWEIDSNNTKCRLIAAIQLMHLPSIVGGDKKRARQLLFSTFPPIHKAKNNISNTTIIEWGQKCEIYGYLAQLALLEKEYTEYRKYKDLALKLQAEYGFVLFDLEKQWNKIKK